MKNFSILAFTLLASMMSAVLAKKKVFFTMKESASLNPDDLSPQAVDAISVFMAIAQTELAEVVTGASAGDIFDGGVRQLRGSNDERKLPITCGSTCNQCRNYYDNSLFTCQTYCGHCDRRNLLDEFIATTDHVETTHIDPMENCKCKVDMKPLTQVTDMAKKKRVKLTKGLTPLEANVTYYVCECLEE
jgi:hypothetical protein